VLALMWIYFYSHFPSAFVFTISIGSYDMLTYSLIFAARLFIAGFYIACMGKEMVSKCSLILHPLPGF